MMKSFQESNGTVLSTNWNEVGKEKVEIYFLRMGIVTELLDFNKVRRFQEFCGIVATKDDDPRGIDAVMR